jgi:recombination protein RecT
MADEVARRTAPTALVEQSTEEFARLLPSHVKPETFARLAVGALRRDQALMDAAGRNLPSLMHALMDAARLGLEPGTEEYYLTPRGGKQPGVVGIVGYQGEIELIYRAGAVSSVKAELVHEADRFHYDTSMPSPEHEVDWFADRGKVLGAYAYAHMVGGGTSKVVVVGPKEIERAMAASPTAGSPHSPWKTDFGAMTLKTAVHQLAKWVPTSAEYRREVARASAEASAGRGARPERFRAAVDPAPLPDAPVGAVPVQPPAPQPAARPSTVEQQDEVRRLLSVLVDAGSMPSDGASRADVVRHMVGRDTASIRNLTWDEARELIRDLAEDADAQQHIEDAVVVEEGVPGGVAG